MRLSVIPSELATSRFKDDDKLTVKLSILRLNLTVIEVAKLLPLEAEELKNDGAVPVEPPEELDSI